MVRKVPRKYLAFSRNLRSNQTPWEDKLWQYLRAKRFYGFKFKRQVNIDSYIVDFYCAEKKLVVELDGGQHSIAEIGLKDQKKTDYLETKGYKVLRFWNHELENNLEGVLEVLRRAIF